MAQSGITLELKKDCRALKETAEHFKAKKKLHIAVELSISKKFQEIIFSLIFPF